MTFFKWSFLIFFMLSFISYSQNNCIGLDKAGVKLPKQFTLSDNGNNRCSYSVENQGLTLIVSYGERMVSDAELNVVANSAIINMNEKLTNFKLLGDGLNSINYGAVRFVNGNCSFLNQGYYVESNMYFATIDGQLLMLNFSYPSENNEKCRIIIENIFR